MPTNYPGVLDALTNPTPSDLLSSLSVPHPGQHGTANDAIEALQAKLGIGASLPSVAGTVLRGTGSGASAYGQVVNADFDVNGFVVGSKINSNAVPKLIYSGAPFLAGGPGPAFVIGGLNTGNWAAMRMHVATWNAASVAYGGSFALQLLDTGLNIMGGSTYDTALYNSANIGSAPVNTGQIGATFWYLTGNFGMQHYYGMFLDILLYNLNGATGQKGMECTAIFHNTSNQCQRSKFSGLVNVSGANVVAGLHFTTSPAMNMSTVTQARLWGYPSSAT